MYSLEVQSSDEAVQIGACVVLKLPHKSTCMPASLCHIGIQVEFSETSFQGSISYRFIIIP